jgi:hypothetical protein
MAQQQRTKAPPPLKPEWRTEYQLRGGTTFTEPQRAGQPSASVTASALIRVTI